MTPLSQRTNTVSTNIIYHKKQISTDLTCKFPLTSIREKMYLFVIYDYDINIILIRPMKAISDSEFIRAFKYLTAHLLTRGLKP